MWIELHGIFLGYTLKHLPFVASTLGQSNNVGIYFSSSPTLPFASSKLSISCQHFSHSSPPSWVTNISLVPPHLLGWLHHWHSLGWVHIRINHLRCHCSSFFIVSVIAIATCDCMCEDFSRDSFLGYRFEYVHIQLIVNAND